METKIIKAVFGGSRYTVTAKRTRTDYGQVLEFVGVDLPDTFECIFSNSATSAGVGKKMIGSDQRVLIPDEYLATGQTIYAWVLVHDGEDDGRHMYNVKIPVADMPNLSPEEPTPVEQSVISQAITALNSAVTTTTQKAQEAADSADRAEHAAEGAEGFAERAENAQQAAENARDRATQAETSARTSAATATEKASEAISSATTASQSALNAETASESARASATASAESASQASASASTASTKAQEASGYASSANTSAQTASQKASEAAQSASSASQAKTDAETAKQASETAQGLAESARDGAVTAKTDAESARDKAQEIVDGITGKVEQIDSNTDRIESLEDDRYKPYAVDTASGAVASFPDGADDIPLKSCIVQIEPVQAGSGDPSPDNVRPISGWTGVEVQHSGEDTSSPTTYPIAFPSEAGTVYGGYIDPINGELVVDRAYEVLNNPDKWSETSGTANFRYGVSFDSRKIYDDSYSGLTCSYVPCLYGAEPYGRWNSASGTDFCIKSSTLTLDQVKADSEAGKISIAYELAEPIHYPLTATEIKTLYGQNNLWADTGDTEVTYRADTKLYIEKLTQPEEYDMIADSAINSGQFFMIGNSLYRALANIASGATITVGTNAERVSLSDALNLVNA